jgi:glycosyltransferase involved in cell wall biosynthesis
MNFSANMSEMGRFRLTKVLHMLSVVARMIYRRFADGVPILYYPPAGNYRVPMYRDLFILNCTRWLFDKSVFHFHAGGVSELYEGLPSWQRWLFRRAYFGADAAIRLSELNPEDGRRLEAKREYVIPYGIDDPRPELSHSHANAAVAVGDRLHLLFVGIVSEAKGIMVLIDACAKLAERGVLFELEIMGQWESDEFAARARQRIDELKLAQSIKFLGVLTGQKKYDAFRRANAFCFPTHLQCETFGLVLLEAMACGLPVVATRWRGIPSIVDEGRTGFLVEPRDSGALADRLEMLAHDASLRERMGIAGREKFEREFTRERHVDRMRRALLETAEVAVGLEEPEHLVDAIGATATKNPGLEIQLPHAEMIPQP